MSFSLRALWTEAAQPETLRAVPFILIGCLITAVGLVYFINPYGIVPGGVFGISIVIHAIFPAIPIGTIASFTSYLSFGFRRKVRTAHVGCSSKFTYIGKYIDRMELSARGVKDS